MQKKKNGLTVRFTVFPNYQAPQNEKRREFSMLKN